MNKRIFYILFFLILLIGIIFRFYKLSEYPVNLSHDEVSQLYDAISVLKTGKDIHGQKLPFIFKSIGDYKPPFYTYTTIPFVYLFGESEVAIRIVGALFGTLLISAVYFFTNKAFSNKYIALLAAFFTAIAPFEIHFSRKGFEGGAGVFMLLLGFGFLLEFFHNPKETKRFVVGSIILAFSMYFYFSFTFVTPILYGVILFSFVKKKLKIPKSGWILFILIVIPLLMFIIQDKSSSNRTRAVAITQDVKLTQILNDKIDSKTVAAPIKKNLIIIRYSLARYLDQFNPTFLFVNGLDLTNQDPIDVGPFYIFQFPLLFIGIIYLFKHVRRKNKNIFLLITLWIIIGLLPSALTFEKHSPHRVLMFLTMLNIIISCGGYTLIRKIIRIQNLGIKTTLIVLSLGIIIWNIFYFIFIYTISHPIDKSEYNQYPYREVALIAAEFYNDYDKIIFDPKFGEYAPWTGGAAEYYLAYYGKYPVEDMQKEYKVSDKTGSEKTFGKYIIRSIYWPEDRKLSNVLVIASPWVISKESFGQAELIKEVKFYNSIRENPALSVQGGCHKGTTAFFVLSLK